MHAAARFGSAYPEYVFLVKRSRIKDTHDGGVGVRDTLDRPGDPLVDQAKPEVGLDRWRRLVELDLRKELQIEHNDRVV